MRERIIVGLAVVVIVSTVVSFSATTNARTLAQRIGYPHIGRRALVVLALRLGRIAHEAMVPDGEPRCRPMATRCLHRTSTPRKPLPSAPAPVTTSARATAPKPSPRPHAPLLSSLSIARGPSTAKQNEELELECCCETEARV